MESYIIIAQAYCLLVSGEAKPSRLIFLKTAKNKSFINNFAKGI